MPSLKLPNLFRRAADRHSLKKRAASLRASVGALTHADALPPAEAAGSDAELLTLAPIWEAAVNLEIQRIAEETTTAESPCDVVWPGPAPADSGPNYEAWRQQVERWRLRSGMAAAEEATAAAGRAVHETELQIASMPATTLAGLRLKARVALRCDALGVVWPDRLGESLARDVLALSDMALVPSQNPQGEPANVAIAEHRAAYAAWEPHLDAIGKPVVGTEAYRAAQIAGAPARLAEEAAFGKLIDTQAQTFPGLVALAAYVPEAIRATGRDDNDDAPTRALHSICCGVLKLNECGAFAAPAGAEISAPAEASPSPTLSPTRRWAIEQAATVDLSGLEILELHNLYNLFASASDAWNAAACLPWADESLNAGEVVEREDERAAEIRDRIVAEIQAKVPTGSLEHGWRLETLIRHALLCEGSLQHAPELRAEITKAWGG